MFAVEAHHCRGPSICCRKCSFCRVKQVHVHQLRLQNGPIAATVAHKEPSDKDKRAAIAEKVRLTAFTFQSSSMGETGNHRSVGQDSRKGACCRCNLTHIDQSFLSLSCTTPPDHRATVVQNGSTFALGSTDMMQSPSCMPAFCKV